MIPKSDEHGKGRKFPPEPLTRDEVAALISQCRTRGPCGHRQRTLLVVLYRAGLRCAEALALKPSDVDLKEGTIRVLFGKGRKNRTVGIDAHAVDIVGRYMEVRRTTLLALGDAQVARKAKLFCTLSRTAIGRPLNPSYVRNWCKRLARQAGLDKRVHPHGMRHTLAVEMVHENIPLSEIQTALGHANAATTDTYLKGVAPAQTIARMRDRDWSPPK